MCRPERPSGLGRTMNPQSNPTFSFMCRGSAVDSERVWVRGLSTVVVHTCNCPAHPGRRQLAVFALCWRVGRRSMLLCLRLSIGAPWQKLGPKNIGDDAQGQGYAGTIADAVSPLSNPDLIYAGGRNLS